MEFQDVIELSEKPRTQDVKTTGSFEALMISPHIIENMNKFGFRTPSPVQEKAIPAGLSGLDLLVQAKSGTGKTLVFSVLSVENLNTQCNSPQRLILAPTREIATQIKDTIKRIAHHRSRVVVLVGGTPLSLDIQALKRGAHIIVGTTGRVSQMVQLGHLSLDSVDLFVLDEADKLMDDCFQKDINYLFSCLPQTRQVAVFSATYPRDLDSTLSKFMKDVTLVRLNADDVQLIGIKQYVSINRDVPVLNSLIQLLKSVSFDQALVFCNHHQDCEETCSRLCDAGFDTVFISSKIKQLERDIIIEKLKQKKIKILVSTDLTARGIDAENINLVINLEAAINVETYFHRIGRAARFGGFGASVTLLRDTKAVGCFSALVGSGNVRVRSLHLSECPSDLTTNKTFYDGCTPFLARVSHGAKKSTVVAKASRGHAPTRRELATLNGDSDLKYDRAAIMEMRQYSCRPSDDLQQRILNAGLSLESDFSDDLKSIAADMKRLKKVAKTSKLDSASEHIPAKPKKFKFVPSRDKAKKKFYMRGEMISIRDSFSAETWETFAASRYDLSTDPFVPAKQSSSERNQVSAAGNKENVQSNRSKSFEATVVKPAIEKAQLLANADIKKYTRKSLLAIQMKASNKAWLSYARAKWDTSEDPWQLDPHLRCPFDEQLRRIRKREKLQRSQVIEARKKAVTERDVLIASSRSISRAEVTESSFEDFCGNLKLKYDLFTMPTAGSTKGSVVPQRDSPAMWKSRLNFYSNWLDDLDSKFKYEVQKTAGSIQEIGFNSIDAPDTSGPSRSPDSEERPGCALNSDELSTLSTMQSTSYNTTQPQVEGAASLNEEFSRPIPSGQMKEPHLDDLGDVVTTSEANDYNEYQSEVEDGLTFQPTVDTLSELATSYRRNVDFNIVFSSYLTLMNNFTR